MRAKIGFIGSGWRAHGYWKVIKELPDRFEVAAILTHSGKSREIAEQEYPGKVYDSFDKFAEQKLDYVMLLVPRTHVLGYVERLFQRNIPVLSETPPGDGLAELLECYRLKQRFQGKIQVAEQYFLQPYHSGVYGLIREGRIGEVSNLTISMIHDYHGISIMRRMLGTGFQNCEITARAYTFPVHTHCGRGGLYGNPGAVTMDRRKVAEFVFEGAFQKVGFFQFSDEQYFNYFRTRHINIQGDKGEIFDDQAAYMGENGYPVKGRIVREDLGQYSNLEGYCLRGLGLNGEWIYRNPYEDSGARLSDDEIAMAGILDGMAEYVRTGKEIYSLEEALQDTYLYLCMEEAIGQGTAVCTKTQEWALSFIQE